MCWTRRNHTYAHACVVCESVCARAYVFVTVCARAYVFVYVRADTCTSARAHTRTHAMRAHQLDGGRETYRQLVECGSRILVVSSIFPLHTSLCERSVRAGVGRGHCDLKKHLKQQNFMKSTDIVSSIGCSVVGTEPPFPFGVVCYWARYGRVWNEMLHGYPPLAPMTHSN